MQVVDELKAKYPAPAKIIVYSSNKKVADRLGEELDCILYHADVDDRAGKGKRLAQWRQGDEQHRVAVATSALGLGVDVGDTRGVIHIDVPRDVAEFVQESGRAGRDGQASESIILMPVVGTEHAAKRRQGMHSQVVDQRRPQEVLAYRHKSQAAATQEQKEMAAEMDDLIHARCRRVVLDRVMDGRFDRSECKPREEVCDICKQRSQAHRV